MAPGRCALPLQGTWLGLEAFAFLTLSTYTSFLEWEILQFSQFFYFFHRTAAKSSLPNAYFFQIGWALSKKGCLWYRTKGEWAKFNQLNQPFHPALGNILGGILNDHGRSHCRSRNFCQRNNCPKHIPLTNCGSAPEYRLVYLYVILIPEPNSSARPISRNTLEIGGFWGNGSKAARKLSIIFYDVKVFGLHFHQ